MSFGSQLREYRDEYLHTSQKQMAQDLGIDPATISRYESNRRGFPIEQLPLIKKLYKIPDDILLAMILGRPLKKVRSFSSQTLDSTAAYEKGFLAQYGSLIESEPLLKEFIVRADSLDEEDRHLLLSGLLNFIQLYENQQRK
ncbi:helix-turn-helix domain-containing protein [Sporosarcina sp. P35]|nr:helix-turn-helix transcriptional regulator [Sporosarcina sp. P35]